MKKIAQLMMACFGLWGSAQACHIGWSFDIYDASSQHMLEGDQAYMFIGSNSMATNSAVLWRWTSLVTGNTPRQVMLGMKSCPYMSTCYIMGYSTYNYDAARLGASEWMLTAETPSTCRALTFTVQKSPTASIASITGTRSTGQTLTFKASGTIDPNAVNSSLRYYWNFGNGATAQGQTVSYVYNTAGTYTVKVRSYDGKYYSAWSSQSISIGGTGGGGGDDPRFPDCGPGTPYQCP